MSDYSSSVNTTQSKIVHEQNPNRRVDEALNNMQYADYSHPSQRQHEAGLGP